MSSSLALVLACFSVELTKSMALRLERGAPDVFDWQVEDAIFTNRSIAARRADPLSDGEKHENSVMRGAVHTLSRKSHQPHWVLIGDSVMRQQYFNLASWLIHGEAVASEPEDLFPTGSLTYQDRWRSFFQFQQKQLQSDNVSEICHCGRDDHWVEDRFVSMPGKGSSISYFGWFGGFPFNGYFNPPDEHPKQASCRAIGLCTSPFRWTVHQPDWRNATGVVDFLSRVVMKLKPKPTHVVLNSGKWGFLTSHGLRTLFAAGAKIQKKGGTRFMWKTVTHSRSDTNNDHQSRVNAERKLAQEYGWEVLDAYSETKNYPGQGHGHMYKDDIHLQDTATTHINRIYMEALLESLP